MHIAVLAAEAAEVPAGLDATVVATGARPWPGSVHVDDVHDAFDVALACGWRAALHLFRLPADGYAYLVPGLEDALLDPGDEQRMLAAATYELPCDLVAETAELGRALVEEHPAARVLHVPLAPKAREFLPAAARADGAPLRIAVSAHASSEDVADEVLARVTGPVQRDSDAHVLLELAPVELTLRAAPGALRAGMPAIVTPAFGHDELIQDGLNGFLVQADDVPAIAERIDRLAGDQELLARMSHAALQTGAALPSAQQAAAELLEALEAVTPAAARRVWPAQILLSALAAARPVRQQRQTLEYLLHQRDREVAELRAENARLRSSGLKAALRKLRGR